MCGAIQKGKRAEDSIDKAGKMEKNIAIDVGISTNLVMFLIKNICYLAGQLFINHCPEPPILGGLIAGG